MTNPPRENAEPRRPHSPRSPEPSDHAARREAFPNTAATWLSDRIEGEFADPRSAREHVMSVYFEPLTIYIQATPFRHLAEPRELVSGFFADRLDQSDFLLRWVRSGLPLRRWLIGGLRFYLLEHARKHKQAAAASVPEHHADPNADEPGSAFNRATGHELIREACRRAADELASRRMNEHWEIFVMRNMDGLDYADIERRTGVPERRAAVMTRTAARRFRRALRDLVSWPGATNEDIDGELATFFGDNT